jgi:hypothetical protein
MALLSEQPIFTIRSGLGGIQKLGDTPYGERRIINMLARDEMVDTELYYFRAFMRFETADPSAAWLNRILAIGRGARMQGAVRLDVFEVL